MEQWVSETIYLIKQKNVHINTDVFKIIRFTNTNVTRNFSLFPEYKIVILANMISTLDFYFRKNVLQKGGDPSTASATDALLRLHPDH